MKTAAEVMNREFFSASPGDTIGAILHGMSEHGMGSVVVLDLDGKPRGVATRVEVERCNDTEELTEKLRSPAVCMDEHTPIDIAARTLALHPSCGVVLLDAKGAAVGALSPIDLLRAVLGIDYVPPRSAAHERDLGWNEAELLELGAAHRAPAAPGIILLSPGFDQSAKRVVWAEATENMRERLDRMLRNPQQDERLESILEVYPRTARFRCLTVFDTSQRERLARALCNVPACARCGSTCSTAPEAPAHASGTSLGGDPSPVLGS
jgi:CBS domain-containing protein